MPVENSMLLAEAMRKHNIPFELHIYPDGVHGLALASEVTSDNEKYIVSHAQEWINLVKEWLNKCI